MSLIFVFFGWGLYVICVHVHKDLWAHMYNVRACGHIRGPKINARCLLSIVLHVFWDTILTETILTRLAGKQALEILLPLYPSRVGIKRCCLLCPVVYMNAGDPNPGPYTSTETALSTEPFPQPLWNLFPKLNLPSNCQKGAPPTSLCMLVQKYILYISNRSFLIINLNLQNTMNWALQYML